MMNEKSGRTAQLNEHVANGHNQNNESAEHQRGTYSMKFKLEDAYRKKLATREKFENRVNKRNWHFNNSCMLSFGKNSSFKAEQVDKSIKEALSEDEYLAIIGMGQFASTKNWQIRFRGPSAFKSAVNKQIRIGEYRYTH